jgi:8-oxo-dGTP diphosphatase
MSGDPGILRIVTWVHVRENRLLVARTQGRDAFYVPGGKPEAGENDVAALTREIREELNVALDPSSVRHLWTIESEAHARPRQRLRMACYRAAGTGKPRPGTEIAELAWVDGADADRCAPAVREVIRRLESDLPAGGSCA